jgi:hypothetical protein
MEELEDETSICLNRKSYSGYVDQNEFTQRYLFIKNRVNNSLTREELAFLLGRTPYFVTDYEELSTAVNLDLLDIDLLCQLMTRNKFEILNFDKKDGQYDISHDKKMVRVTRYNYLERIEYKFTHRWTILGENKPLRITEPIFKCIEYDDDPTTLIKVELTRLIAGGYFNPGRSPLEIRDYVWNAYKYKSSSWSAELLKNVVYEFIRDNKLVIGNHKGHYSYQINRI